MYDASDVTSLIDGSVPNEVGLPIFGICTCLVYYTLHILIIVM